MAAFTKSVLALVVLGVTFGQAGVATAAVPCAPGTPSALRFFGLPGQVPVGRTEWFSLDFDHDDWYVEGDINVTMSSGGVVFFQRTTDDSLAELSLHLDEGESDATVVASFEQVTFAEDGESAFSCVQTISRTVAAFTAPVRLFCNRWDRWGDNISYRTSRPHRCSIWREDWSHAQSASFIKARWRGWGKPVARARATLVYNMGYRAPIRIRASRLRFDCTGRHRVYTRVSIVGPDGHGVVRPDTCV